MFCLNIFGIDLDGSNYSVFPFPPIILTKWRRAKEVQSFKYKLNIGAARCGDANSDRKKDQPKKNQLVSVSLGSQKLTNTKIGVKFTIMPLNKTLMGYSKCQFSKIIFL